MAPRARYITGMKVQLTITYTWLEMGAIKVDDDGKIKFPIVPQQPGLYRFSMANATYVGESTELRRRLNGYRNPGPTQLTNQRLNADLKNRLDQGQEIRLDICTSVDGGDLTLSLGAKEVRLLAENAAIIRERALGRDILNL